MTPGQAFYREAGRGPAVVCIHASASSSSQWRLLTERLAGRFRVLAADLYGAGKSPAWPGGRPLSLADEVALLRPVLAAASEPFHLVGHSYGGAVALAAALAEPERVASLVLFEPVLFSVLIAEDPTQPAAREIVAVRDDTVAALERGDPHASGARFVDYWMGAGTGRSLPAPRREALAAAMSGVKAEWDAAFREPTPLAAFAALDMPVLYITGSESPASARGVARLLTKTLPRVTTIEVEGVGHMGPVTHPDRVNALIERHLEPTARSHQPNRSGGTDMDPSTSGVSSRTRMLKHVHRPGNPGLRRETVPRAGLCRLAATFRAGRVLGGGRLAFPQAMPGSRPLTPADSPAHRHTRALRARVAVLAGGRRLRHLSIRRGRPRHAAGPEKALPCSSTRICPAASSFTVGSVRTSRIPEPSAPARHGLTSDAGVYEDASLLPAGLRHESRRPWIPALAARTLLEARSAGWPVGCGHGAVHFIMAIFPRAPHRVRLRHCGLPSSARPRRGEPKRRPRSESPGRHGITSRCSAAWPRWRIREVAAIWSHPRPAARTGHGVDHGGGRPLKIVAAKSLGRWRRRGYGRGPSLDLAGVRDLLGLGGPSCAAPGRRTLLYTRPSALSHEIVGKLTLGPNPDEQRAGGRYSNARGSTDLIVGGGLGGLAVGPSPPAAGAGPGWGQVLHSDNV